jgi:amino-acid N-acetyltransferase
MHTQAPTSPFLPSNDTLQLQQSRPAQRQEILALLTANQLPVADITEAVTLYVLTKGGSMVGTAGLEKYGTAALLRSVSIVDEGKGRGWGSELVQLLEEDALREGIREFYLLTTTAEGFFSKRGYRRIQRQEVPDAVAASGQFKGICPASAPIMRKRLG